MTTHPDGLTSTTEYENGRPVTSERKANGGAVVASTSYEYDPHGRLWKQTDGRVGTQTIYTYNDADQTTSVNAGGMVTSYTHNDLGQVITETLPGSGRTIIRTYLPTGEALTEEGSATYPITYTYDPQGRRRTMVTSSGTTTWNYSSTRGWLTSKADAQSEATSYTYTSAGRLSTRTWARGVVTTYGYNGAGELNSVSYSDGTPGVTFIHDSQGRPVQITDASGTRTLSYNSVGQLEGESISGGILNGVSLSATYDGLLRRSSFTAARNSATLASSALTYDGASRLATVSSGDQTAAYNYLAGSSLVSQIAFKQSGTPAMITTKSYDGLNRLSSISSAPAVGDPVSYAYRYNAAGQRDQITLANGDTWNYGYNDRGEVTSGSKKQGGITNLLGYQFGYDFDDLGNRTSAVTNGRTSTYSTNSLNQYTSRTVPSYADVIGKAKPTTAVTVNSLAATRQGEEYHKELSVDNSAAPVYLSTSVKGTLGSDTAEVNGKLFIPKTPEAFAYDKDGNLLSDGRWTYEWDGENRLIRMATQASAVTAGTPKQRLTFAYDQQGRRISKKVEDWKGSRYQERFTMLFLYDGWNLAAEVLSTGPKIRSYMWGSDLSGGTAAGGVGGLLFVGQYPEGKVYSAGYDGNGNIIGFFDMEASGDVAATSEYGPFGEVLQRCGRYGNVNPFGWSTKQADSETGLYCYGFRYYDQMRARWISRDPAEEQGGANLYGFLSNDSLNNVDYLGLRLVWSGTFVHPAGGLSNRAFAENVAREVTRIFRQIGISFGYGIHEVPDVIKNSFWLDYQMRFLSGSDGERELQWLNRNLGFTRPILIVEKGMGRSGGVGYHGLGAVVQYYADPVVTARLVAHEYFHVNTGFRHGNSRFPGWDTPGLLTHQPMSVSGYHSPDKERIHCSVEKWIKKNGGTPDPKYVVK